jgi:hypothetical protein
MKADMKANQPLNAAALLKEAEESEHHEAYRILEKAVNYRIGVGVRLAPTIPPHFFVEILVYLAPNDDGVDVTVLEKSVSALKELQAKGFTATFQDGNCISCETQVPQERLPAEYELDKTLMKKAFENKPNSLPQPAQPTLKPKNSQTQEAN